MHTGIVAFKLQRTLRMATRAEHSSGGQTRAYRQTRPVARLRDAAPTTCPSSGVGSSYATREHPADSGTWPISKLSAQADSRRPSERVAALTVDDSRHVHGGPHHFGIGGFCRAGIGEA
jgi:hypothetical protein